MKTVAINPARLASTRLPNKVLLDLGGKSVAQRVYEQALKAKKIDAVYIATDSDEVQQHCKTFTQNVIMTDSTHESGTDRIAQVVEKLKADIVINVQGDEPFIEPQLIDDLIEALDTKSLTVKELSSFLFGCVVKNRLIDSDIQSILYLEDDFTGNPQLNILDIYKERGV